MKTTSSIAALALAATTLLACGGQGAPGGNARSAAPAPQGNVLAMVGDKPITDVDFELRMDEQSPFIRARYNTMERKREFLDDMVRFELLAQEAERLGLQNDPDVQETLRKVIVQKLVRQQFDEGPDIAEIPEEDLRAFYDENISDYVKPERIRLSHIFIAAEAKDAAARRKAANEARTLLRQVRAREAGTVKTAFAETARERSEDAATRTTGGDLLFKTKDELAETWGQAFADAAFGLETIGEIATQVVETDRGYHLIKLTGRQAALDRSFESVKNQIKNRLTREKRTRDFDAFVASLREKTGVRVDEEALARVQVAPQKEGVGMKMEEGMRQAIELVPGSAEPAAAAEAPRRLQPASIKKVEKVEPTEDEMIELQGPGGQKRELPRALLERLKERNAARNAE